jgi:hypothetical protein
VNQRERDEQYLAYLHRHREFVLDAARELGVPERGLTHDLSKFEPDEFVPYANYFYGGYERGQVPPDVQEAFNYAWLLHQRRNDHHHQSWVLRLDTGATVALAMPDDARREMMADWKGAGRAILGLKANTADWYRKNQTAMVLHPSTRQWVELALSGALWGTADQAGKG